MQASELGEVTSSPQSRPEASSHSDSYTDQDETGESAVSFAPKHEPKNAEQQCGIG